jgi:hypothetical protein
MGPQADGQVQWQAVLGVQLQLLFEFAADQKQLHCNIFEQALCSGLCNQESATRHRAAGKAGSDKAPKMTAKLAN